MEVPGGGVRKTDGLAREATVWGEVKDDNHVSAPRALTETYRAPAIELRHLRYFLAVSEELHFRRAAALLHIAQPPLSQAIRKLEEQLGVVLLERTSRSVGLTDAGRAFAPEARRVLSGLDRAVAVARQAGRAGSDLRVGIAPHMPTAGLLEFLKHLARKLEADTRHEVIHMSTIDQMRGLRLGTLELGVFPRLEEGVAIEMEPVFPGEPLAAFMAPDHRRTARPVLRPADVVEETLVCVPHAANPALCAWLRSELEQTGYRFGDVHEVGGSDHRDRLLAVASGRGIALLPASAAELGAAGSLTVVRPLDPPVHFPDTVVAWNAEAPRHLRPLIAAARDVARDLRSQE
jgi:DNA-binding transcriptional LysR family regulator